MYVSQLLHSSLYIWKYYCEKWVVWDLKSTPERRDYKGGGGLRYRSNQTGVGGQFGSFT